MATATRPTAITEQYPPSGATWTEGWLETRWNQNGIYNQYCPFDPVDAPNLQNGLLIGTTRCFTGCVATAMGQIVNYWGNKGRASQSVSFTDADNYPSTVYPKNSPTRSMYIDVAIDGSNDGWRTAEYERNASISQIDYPGMNGQTPSDTTMIARLLYACGVSVKMQYSDKGSGAVTSTVARALTDYFGFERAEARSPLSGGFGGVPYSATFYPDLIANMKSGQPVQLDIRDYDVTTKTYPDGHSIVCDGYRKEDGVDRFHLNVGWGGVDDTWYALSRELPDKYTVVSYAVMNIQGASADNTPPRLLNARVTPTSGATSSTFEFLVDYTDADGDAPDPNYRYVYIDGTPHQMSLKNGSAASGTYYYRTQLLWVRILRVSSSRMIVGPRRIVLR